MEDNRLGEGTDEDRKERANGNDADGQHANGHGTDGQHASGRNANGLRASGHDADGRRASSGAGLRGDPADRPATRRFKDSVPLLGRPEQLRARADEDGYLFFRGLLNRRKLDEVRLQLLAILQRWDLLAESAAPEVGIADIEAVNRLPADSVVGFGVPLELYREVQKLEAFHALAHSPELLGALRVLFGEEAFPHPRNIARIVLPHRAVKPTPPHQDFLHIQGSTRTWTAWFPLHDCPAGLGGLSMLEGSHRAGTLSVTAHEGAGGLESILCELDCEWAEDDYAIGDVVIFHSQTVHKALPNRQSGRIRLSCDFRYQPAAEPIDPSSLLPHGGTLYDWEDLYDGWRADGLRYYWKDRELALSAWDESIRWQKDKIC